MNSITAMASSSKTTPVKGKEGKREWSESKERPREPRELVPTETNELALLLRVQQKGGWGLECIAPETFNSQVIHWKVKQVTGVEPLSVDLVNDVDVILELPNDALVTRVGQELQKVVEWGGGYDVDVSSLMVKQSVIADVTGTHTEMVEIFRYQREEATRLHENVQRDCKMLTDLIHRIDEQSRVVNAVRQHQESVPQIVSSIITPSIQAVNPSKNSKPSNLPIFSGDVPTPHGEVEYTQWIFQVRSFRESYTNEAIKNAVIANCRGRANVVV